MRLELLVKLNIIIVNDYNYLDKKIFGLGLEIDLRFLGWSY